MNLKKIVSIVLLVSLCAGLLSFNAFAEDKTKDAGVSVFLSDVTVYEAVKDETKIVVPIYVTGTIDMQCFDITVTYDKSSLTLVKEESYIELPESDGERTIGTTNSSTSGTVRFAGVSVEESMASVTGKIGQVVFTPAKRVSKDNMTAELGLSIAELGYGTEVADIEVKETAVVTLNKSANPNTPDPDVTLGDVNGDKEINSVDALEVLKYAAKLTEFTDAQFAAGDVNKDGDVNAVDALKILRVAAKLDGGF